MLISILDTNSLTTRDEFQESYIVGGVRDVAKILPCLDLEGFHIVWFVFVCLFMFVFFPIFGELEGLAYLKNFSLHSNIMYNFLNSSNYPVMIEREPIHGKLI